MGLDLPVLILTGLQESFSPPLLAMAGSLGLALLFLRPSGSEVLRLFFVRYMVTLVLLRVFFDSGLANVFVLAPRFLAVASGAYLVLGVIFLITSVAFLYERQALVRDPSLPFAGFVRGLKSGNGVASVIAVVLAVVAAFWVNAWPLSYQVAVQGSLLITANGFFDSLWVLIAYELLRNAGSLLAGGTLLLSLSGKFAGVVGRRKTLVSVMMSAAYLAAGVSLFSFCYMVRVGP